MDTVSTTLSYCLLYSTERTRVQHQPQPVTVIKLPPDVDASTNEYNDFAIHFAKLRAIETDRTLWLEGAEPPSGIAHMWARVVLQQLQADSLMPTRVVASAEGGVAICFVSREKYSDLECLNTGAILGVTSNRRDRPTVWEIEQSSSGISQALSRIRRFLHPSAASANDSERQGGRRRLSAISSALLSF
jgi:hypothetical protein